MFATLWVFFKTFATEKLTRRDRFLDKIIIIDNNELHAFQVRAKDYPGECYWGGRSSFGAIT